MSERKTEGNICYYFQDGKVRNKEELTNDNIGHTMGMMIRCTMKDGSIFEGYSNPFRSCSQGQPKFDGLVHDRIYLWKWDHLDENTHQLVGDNDTKFDQTFTPIKISEISDIDVILYSSGRWGGGLTNRFSINIG